MENKFHGFLMGNCKFAVVRCLKFALIENNGAECDNDSHFVEGNSWGGEEVWKLN
jgi:hypothetical protein